jgi:hypothetical protein
MASQPQEPKATLDRIPEGTGRDGAIDFQGKKAALDAAHASNGEARFAQALGRAVIKLWSELPKEVQERIFEGAVVMGHHDERDEMLREQLAKFLHDRHERTSHAQVGGGPRESPSG